MNYKKISVLLVSVLFVAACSSAKPSVRKDAGLPGTVKKPAGDFTPPPKKTVQSTGSTVNDDAKKAFQAAVTNLDKIDTSASKSSMTGSATSSKEAAPQASEQAVLSPAEQSLSQAVQADPNFGKAWFNLGVVREKLGKKEDAKAAYLKSIEASPHLGSPHVNLGVMAYKEAGDPDVARPYFEDAIAADKYNTAALSNMSALYRIDGDADLNIAKDCPPPPIDIDELISNGKSRKPMKKTKPTVDNANCPYRKAEMSGRQALNADPLNLDAYANLARNYYQWEKYDLALLVCLNALKIEKRRPDILNIAGLIWLKKKDVTEGIRQFRSALQVDPNYIPALMNLGAVMLNVRNYDKAIDNFKKVVELEPKNIEARVSLAVAYRGKGDLEQSKKIYEEVEKEDPQNPIIAYNQGILEQEQLAQNAQRGIGASPAPEDPIKMMDWQIENIKRSLEHYQKAIDHFNDYLAWEKKTKGKEKSLAEARKRIQQVNEIMKISADQIPQLEQQKQEMEEDLKQEQAGGGGDSSATDDGSSRDSSN